MISWENYEEYMMMHADGELQPAEEQELMAFLNAHPELKSELALYEATRLSPDETLVFTGKNALIKPGPSKRAIPLPHWQRYAIAAGIAALLLIPVSKYWNANRNNTIIVKTDTAKQILPATNNTASVDNNYVPQQSVAFAPIQPDKTTPVIHHEHIAMAHNTNVTSKKQEAVAVVNNNSNTTGIQPDHINALALVPIKTLSGNTAQQQLTTVTVPAYEVQVSNEVNKRSFIDRLPLDAANKRQVKGIANFIAGTAGKIKTIELDKQTIAITF